MIRAFTFVTVIALAAGALAAAAGPPTIASVFDSQVTSAERDAVPLAEAMPADKYDFAPSNGNFKGVRTFAQQAKHLSAVIYLVSAAALEQKPPVDTGGESGPDSVKTKEQIVQFMKDAFAYGHKAAQSLTAKNQLDLVPSAFGDGKTPRAGMVGVVAWHTFDHYGQMVVYLRMNGIVPPASR
jgi:uncharacterized damage-inducible protein DinB